MTPVQLLTPLGRDIAPPWLDDASEMALEGLSAPAIARRVGAAVETVRKWVGWRCPQCRIPYRAERDEPGKHYCSGCRRTWEVA